MNKGALTEIVQELKEKLAVQDMELSVLKQEIHENEKQADILFVEIVKELRRLDYAKENKRFPI